MHPDLLELLGLLKSHEVDFLVVGSTAMAVHARFQTIGMTFPLYSADISRSCS